MKLAKEKEEFARFWENVIVFEEKAPSNFVSLENSQIINWMFESLMNCSAKILARWGVVINQEVIDIIHKEKNSNNRAVLERNFILDFHQGITNFMLKRPYRKYGDKIGSWPLSILESSCFNCVGGTTLSMLMISRLKLNSFVAILPSHVLNIVELSNGRYFLFDLINNRFNFIPDTKIVNYENLSCLDMSKNIGYQFNFIPIVRKVDIIYTILFNANHMTKVATGNKEVLRNINGDEAFELFRFYAEHKDFFPSYSLLDAANFLLPNIKKTIESEKIRKELDRNESF